MTNVAVDLCLFLSDLPSCCRKECVMNMQNIYGLSVYRLPDHEMEFLLFVLYYTTSRLITENFKPYLDILGKKIFVPPGDDGPSVQLALNTTSTGRLN